MTQESASVCVCVCVPTTYPRWLPPLMMLIKNPLSPSTTRCEQRLAKDGKKTPVRHQRQNKKNLSIAESSSLPLL